MPGRSETNFWGSAVVGMERLAEVGDVEVICFDHDNERDMQQVTQSALWQAMPFVREQRFQRVPAVWFYGATLSAMHFARVLDNALGGARHECAYRPVSRRAARVLSFLAARWRPDRLYNLRQALPLAQWQQAMSAPDIDNIRQMLFHYSLLPRLAVSLLVGAGLGLVGVLFQQVLRNPLAEPTTLGVATGAQLGITITTLWALPGGVADPAVCGDGRGGAGGRAGLWRRLGQASVAGDADSGRAGGEPVLRARSTSCWCCSITISCKACSCGVPAR